jgi:hypothetical protein
MTDRIKFEQMLELLINENREQAEELFHDLVVAKSREIYESLLDDDYQVEDTSEEDEEVEESTGDEEEEDMEEGFMGFGEVGGVDQTDDFLGDVGGDEMGDEFGGDEMGGDEFGGNMDEPATKGDLADMFDDLKAEFEAMLSGTGLDQDGDGDHDMSDHDAEENPFASDGEDEYGSEEDEEQEEGFVREYVENVGMNWDKANQMRSEKNSPNTKSIVAGKNDMGGTTANIARGGSEAGVEANKGQLKGSSLIKQTPQDLKTGNVNVPGSKTATKLSNVAKGHGAEKKGTGETGVAAKSLIGSRK